MTGEVAAIDSRDVLRQEWFESLSVVPVEEMTVQATQLRKGCKRQLLSFDQFERADVTEIARRVIAEEQQADVCRRSAMRDDWRGIFLKVVGWDPVVFRAHKSFKEAPRAARDQPRKRRVFFVQKLSFRRSRLAYPVSN